MREIKQIILHSSDSDFGNAEIINRWHRDRGFSAEYNGKKYYIGYHWVILNGFRAQHVDYDPRYDGAIEPGRPEELVGAHVVGQNKDSLGVCLIGADYKFTVKQILTAVTLVKSLQSKYGIADELVKGHYEYNSAKTCPQINMSQFRGLLRYEICPAS